MELTGAQALIKSLEMEHVEVAFGMPGGCILPAYDPLLESSIRHVLVRHEQGAGHMAEGYAHVTGKPGVAIVTSGPAATNLVTPLMDAYMDSIPMVAITGQQAVSAIGTDAFQEADTVGITRSTTKHNELVTSPEDLPLVIRQAFHIATTGRPGPVLVDVPKDVLTATMQWHWPTDDEVRASLPGYRPTTRGHGKQVKAAAAAIASAERPVFYIGGGILKARAASVLRELADRTGIPVVTTLMARGAFPDDHPQNLGMPGMHGNYTAVTAMQRSDLLIALGARFDDRVTGKLDGFAPDAKVIHVDVDPAELSKVRNADIPIVGDCAAVIEQLVHALDRHPVEERPSLDPWWGQLRAWQDRYPLAYEPAAEGGAVKPQAVIEALSEQTPDDTIIVSGVGQHQMWASQYYKFRHPYTWVNSGGLGTMGFAVPAAVGAKMGRPDTTVWAVDGDGCFQMTSQELITAALEKIPVKIAILNNSYLGMVRQWQELFYGERYSNVHLAGCPDFVKLAEAMGCAGFRVTDPNDVAAVIDKANGINDRPVVVEFVVEEMEKVYPMVPAGVSNDAILVGPLGDREATTANPTVPEPTATVQAAASHDHHHDQKEAGR